MTERDVQRRPNEKVYCLHCNGECQAKDLRVVRGLVYCSDRSCNGNGIDLDFEPWWRES